LVVFPTTDFKAFVLPADSWRAIFVIATLVAVGWLAHCIYVAIRSPSVDDVVERIKRASPAP
jgi:hypothetical protein